MQKILGPILAPLSLIYGSLALARRRLGERGLPKPWIPPRPCVSVGNISWGGTGKTPVTDWLLTHAAQRGLKAVVLTRGYGANPPSLPLKVLPGMKPEHCGDEPLMLAKHHPEATVLVDPDRNRAGKKAMETEQPDLFILDDGFQHLSTGRHTDLVLLDPEDVRRTPLPKGQTSSWNRVLPWGTWREPAGTLNAADAFLIKVEPEDWPRLKAELSSRLSAYPRPVFAFRLRPDGLRPCGAQTSPEGVVYPHSVLAPELASEPANDFVVETEAAGPANIPAVAEENGEMPNLTETALEPINMPVMTTGPADMPERNGAELPSKLPIVLSTEILANPDSLPLLTAADLPGPYLLISGVGNPEQVRRTVERFMGRPPEKYLSFPDHYDFAANREELLKALPPLPVVCTAKDAVKLGYLPQLYALDVTAEFFASMNPSRALLRGAAQQQKPLPTDFAAWLDVRLAEQRNNSNK